MRACLGILCHTSHFLPVSLCHHLVYLCAWYQVYTKDLFGCVSACVCMYMCVSVQEKKICFFFYKSLTFVFVRFFGLGVLRDVV